MRVILIAVSSVNGKITKGTSPNIYSWTSKEDTSLFFLEIKKHNLIVMGANTYEAAKKIIKHERNKLRIILTRNPKKYLKETITGILEFTNESPLELTKKLERSGYKEMLLVGGATVNSLFLKSHLVNKLHLALEPKIFGEGKGLVSEERLEVKLKLISIQTLNNQGTLLLKYNVQKV